VVSLFFSDFTAIEDDHSYTLATNDYLAYGGDNMKILAALPKEVIGISVLDAVVENLRALPTPVIVPAVQQAVQIQ
jgi:2',3'-cyclic-nucleotide 2'-phosphodiesterase (5'-nucleotidase family)